MYNYRRFTRTLIDELSQDSETCPGIPSSLPNSHNSNRESVNDLPQPCFMGPKNGKSLLLGLCVKYNRESLGVNLTWGQQVSPLDEF